MSDTPPATTPETASEPLSVPDPARAEPVRGPHLVPFPWWFPGLVLGAVIGAVAGIEAAGDVVRDQTPRGANRATARVLVRAAQGEGALSEAERQRVAFLFRDRDLLARALAAPDVAELGSLAGVADPVLATERQLTVEVTEGGVVTVTLLGDAPGDLRAILEQIVARFAEEFAALNRKARDDRTAQLEKLAAALRTEIDLQEKAIAVLAKAHETAGPGEAGVSAAQARDRLTQLEAELARAETERATLARRVEGLKWRRSAGAAADPIEVARMMDTDPRVAPLITQRADAVVAVERERSLAPGAATVKDLQGKLDRAERALAAAREPVRKEVEALLRSADARRAERELGELEVQLAVARAAQEALQRDREAARKALESGRAGGANIESQRRSLGPQQEQLDKLQSQLVQIRVAGDVPVRTAGAVTVEPVRESWRWGAAWGAALRTFAVTFGLVTAFQLTGLVFRVLQPIR